MQADAPHRFGNLLRRARRDAGLTQEELAEQSGVSARAISDLERGLSRAPQEETLRLLCDALDIPQDTRREWRAARRQLSTRVSRSTEQPVSEPGQIPVLLDSFVGRHRELEQVRSLLSDSPVRVLTISGPGGVGKTRFALAAAGEVKHTFSDGVWFVDLSAVRNPERVFSTIASTLGVIVSGSEPVISALIGKLRLARLLLILDNFEHLVSAAQQVAALAIACPYLKLLVTSRVPLRIQGEHEYSLPPLSLPDERATLSVDDLRGYESIDLFEQRAKAIQFGFQIDASNAADVAAICRRLDGLPLAIELTVARIRMLPPAALLAMLERRMSRFANPVAGTPERHLTLYHTITWSYDLLDARQQALFRALGAFRGGWTLDAAEHVLQQGLSGEISDLEALVMSHLVRAQMQQGGWLRYSMLETIAEFAREQLDASEDAAFWRRNHAEFFLGLAEAAELRLRGPDQEAWMERLEVEHANIREALVWNQSRAEEGDDIALVHGLRLARAAWWFWYVRGHLLETREFMKPLVQLFHGRIDMNDSLAGSAEVAAAYAHAVFGLATISYWHEDPDLFATLFQECARISKRFNHTTDVAYSQMYSGYLAGHFGHYAEAHDWFKQAIDAFQGIGHDTGLALCYLGHGEVWLREAMYDLAADALLTSLQILTGLADARGMSAARATLGAVRLGQNRIAEARNLLAESVRVRFEIGDKGGIAWSLERLADLALMETAPQDDPAMRAARLLGAARHLRDSIGSPLDPVDVPVIERILAATRARLSSQAFVAAWEAGRAMPLEQIVAYALAADSDNAFRSAANP